MFQGISRSVTGMTLAVLVGVPYACPAIAQIPTIQDSPSPATPLPPVAPQTQASPQPGAGVQPSAYTLGAGDIIRVDSFDTQELQLEPRYNILLDGAVNLPWVGSVKLQNLTLEEASRELSAQYSRFIRNPVITVTLVAPRPLKVGVIGEVNRPGSYIISVISNESTLAGLTQRTGSEGGNQWPTVSRAIQTAGGITQLASIRQIEVVRPSRAEGVPPERLKVNLYKFLVEGDLAQDILLRDGDSVVIPTATALEAEEITKVAVSNFSPETMRVSVVGEVVSPGTVQIRPNSTLNQAVLAAGGFRSNRADRDVELIRLQPDGTVDRRKIRVELSQKLDKDANPPLQNNDIVVVRRSTLGNLADFMGLVLPPFSGALGLLNLLGLPFPP